MWFESTGIIEYTPLIIEPSFISVYPGIGASLKVDQGIFDFYRALVPRLHCIKRQMHPAHITVVRNLQETPVNLDFWGKYEGEEISFLYQNVIEKDGSYYFLRCESPMIAEIRKELGLPIQRDHVKGYHITIRNVK